MKRVFRIFSLLIISVLVLCGCNKKLNSYTEITYSELEEKKLNNETFPLVIGSSTCSACESHKITMNNFIEKNQIEVFYIDLDGLTDNEKSTLKSETNYTATPTTLFYLNGQITMAYNRLVGAVSLQSIKDAFKENNYID